MTEIRIKLSVRRSKGNNEGQNKRDVDPMAALSNN